MRRSGQPCKDKQLPSLPRIEHKEQSGIEYYMASVEVDDVILLHEFIKDDGEFYWIILQADVTPLIACEFEAYTIYGTEGWNGRRSDYLLIGWYSGECYLVFTELRQNITNEEQSVDKLNQLEQTIGQFLTHKQTFDSVERLLQNNGSDNGSAKLMGIVLAPRGTKKKALTTRYRKAIINRHEPRLIVVPSSQLSNCQISWTQIMYIAGETISEQENRMLPHRYQSLWP